MMRRYTNMHSNRDETISPCAYNILVLSPKIQWHTTNSISHDYFPMDEHHTCTKFEIPGGVIGLGYLVKSEDLFLGPQNTLFLCSFTSKAYKFFLSSQNTFIGRFFASLTSPRGRGLAFQNLLARIMMNIHFRHF